MLSQKGHSRSRLYSTHLDDFGSSKDDLLLFIRPFVSLSNLDRDVRVELRIIRTKIHVIYIREKRSWISN